MLHPGGGSLLSELPSQRTALVDQARIGLKPSTISQFIALTLQKSNQTTANLNIVKSLQTDSESLRHECERLKREQSDKDTLIRDL